MDSVSETGEGSSRKRKRKNLVRILESQSKAGTDEVETASKCISRTLESVQVKTELSVDAPVKKKFWGKDENLVDIEKRTVVMKFKKIRCQVCTACKASFSGDHTYSQSGKMLLSQNSKACLNPIIESFTRQINQSDNDSEIQVNASKQNVARSNIKKPKVQKNRNRKCLCQDCPGCQAKSCGDCKLCNSGKMELCSTKHCSNPKWESVPLNKVRLCEAETESLPDEKSSTVVVGGVSYEFRCTICNIIPKKQNRSELYRHYSTEHFNVQIRNEFGHLKLCPLCNLDVRKHNQFSINHFGQKHDMVEKFLPPEARIPRNIKGPKLSQTRTKYKTTRAKNRKKLLDAGVVAEAEDLKVIKIDGFDNEFTKDIDEGDVNVSLVEEKVTDHSPKASDQVLLVLCKVCKQKFFSVEATVLHIQYHMKGPDDLNSHFQDLLRSGHVIMTSKQASSSQDDLIPVEKVCASPAASKTVASSDLIKEESRD